MMKAIVELMELENELGTESFDPEYVGENIERIFNKTKVEYTYDYDYTEVGPGYSRYLFYIAWVGKDGKPSTYAMTFEF